MRFSSLRVFAIAICLSVVGTEVFVLSSVALAEQDVPNAVPLESLHDGDCINLVSRGDIPGNRYLDANADYEAVTIDANLIHVRTVYLSPQAPGFVGTTWKLHRDSKGLYSFSVRGKTDAWLEGDRDVNAAVQMPQSPVYLTRRFSDSSTDAKWAITPDEFGGYILVSQHGSGADKYLDGHTASPDHDVFLSSATTEPYSGTHWAILRVNCP